MTKWKSPRRNFAQFSTTSFNHRFSGVFVTMLSFSVLVVCLLILPQGQTVPRRYKPVIQVTEEIDINDITFTTSAPEYERSKTPNYYNGIKPEGKYKGNYPLEKYTIGQTILVPAVKYKPYKVYKPVSYKSDKGKILIFEPPTTFSGLEPSKHSAKTVPFTGLPSKAPTREVDFYTEKPKFIPSPTFSPTVLAQINSDNSQKFSEVDIQPFTQKETDWAKPTKRPHYTQKLKKTENQYQPTAAAPTDFPDKIENPTYKDSPQSESFLSEISTIHKGGGNNNNLEGVADLKTGERVEFQMYGMDGPQSYKFGFDTGKGLNRHFRFEERDNTGKVKGHYGYLDEDGKMRIMKYEADPITGFHAGPVEISPEEN